ncbi:uncharacterized protein METZ01_LOCUS207928 [marine metagenome]|uniref:Uncharacterized protein n=1 Tax=marine metagenome TaxID=408172 RepID=A0A382EY97_9ZZZZ
MENYMNENRDRHQAFTEYLDRLRRVLLLLEMAHADEDQQAYARLMKTVTHIIDEMPKNIETSVSTRSKDWLGL